VSPDVFVPLAEHTGLIHSLTSLVLDKAMAQCKALQDAGHDIKMAVNLSGQNLLDVKMPARIAQGLEKAGLATSALELEITETSIIADPPRAKEVLVELDKQGISLALDDFGTGYTSLSYLGGLPISTLKIDKSFVMNMLHDPKDAAIVRSTIDLAKHLGIKVVAEGVESRAVWDQLTLLGCDYAQGYFLARPMPSEDLFAWLNEYASRRSSDPLEDKVVPQSL
jgi:EAL domain-containing protein (putative c-di-GMP-specific phosphodiesterase class I)